MSQYGNLQTRVKETDNGLITAYVGELIVPDLLTGSIAIAERDVPQGGKMTHVVKVNQGTYH